MTMIWRRCGGSTLSFTARPFFGARRIARTLSEEGFPIDRKRVRRLMRVMGIEALGPKPRTTKPAPGHKIYPYLLRDLTIDRPNHVWAADITYIPIGRGFLDPVAVIDWASRAVLSWRLSNTMDASFCLAALEDALARYGRPEIFNTDQGSQFTGAAFTGALIEAGVRISMDGRGRWMDNVFIERVWRSLKYEDVYLRGYADGKRAVYRREAKARYSGRVSDASRHMPLCDSGVHLNRTIRNGGWPRILLEGPAVAGPQRQRGKGTSALDPHRFLGEVK